MAYSHLILRAEIREAIGTPARADEFMRQAVAAAGMNIIAGPFSVLGNVPGNEGVSATVILDLSSANLHEWPGRHPCPLVHFDLFTCGRRPHPEHYRALLEPFGLVSFGARVIDRDALLGTGRFVLLMPSLPKGPLDRN